MPIRAVVYASEAMPVVAEASSLSGKLGGIVEDAARFNLDAGVTGVLLFDGGRFLQYLEGPEDGLSVAYSRVVGASSHSGLVELQRGRVGHRRLPFWPMQLLPVEAQELARMTTADWTSFFQRGDAAAPNASGMDLLVSMVQRRVASV